MFNIYIYDYCNKRGFRETAQKLMVEAEIPPDSAPPINARQGLLFEWWSVFWVLFTAKSSGTGSDDAMLYVQQQSQQAAQRQSQARMQPQQPPMNRYINGIQRPPGVMPNGAGPASLQGAPGPMPNGAPGSMSFPMSGPQPNGMPGSSAGPSVAPGTPQQPQTGFQPMLPGQRPGVPQQRGPNNGPPFQSPTMAHSPQNSGVAPGQQQPPAIGQVGPSPHMSHMQRSGNMLPPNGQQQAGNPAFQQLHRPPSRTASPSNIMTQPSPSMANRQPQGGMPAQEASLNNELARMPPQLVTALRQELGLADKDLQSLTIEDKQRLVTLARQRVGNVKPGPPGGNNAAAGPSMQPLQRPQRQSISQPRGNKRNSTSPADEQEMLPRNDQSPPDRKRLRRSPLNAEQGPPMSSISYPQQGQPQGGQGGPQQLPNGMMRPMGGPGLNGFQGGMPSMGNNPGMNMQMGPQMSPQGMVTVQQQQQQQISMARFQQEQQYRQTMHNLHKGSLTGSGALSNAMPGNAGSPSSGDVQGQGPQFAGGVGPNNRMTQKGMMLPPSPVGGLPKDQSGQNKDKGGQSSTNSRPEGSPRNPPRTPGQGSSGNPGQGGTAPATPNMAAPSPSAILSNPSSVMNQAGPSMVSSTDPMAIFGGTDFMGSIPALDSFDDASLKANFDVDFERDFGQWFNPENEVAGSLDPK